MVLVVDTLYPGGIPNRRTDVSFFLALMVFALALMIATATALAVAPALFVVAGLVLCFTIPAAGLPLLIVGILVLASKGD